MTPLNKRRLLAAHADATAFCVLFFAGAGWWDFYDGLTRKDLLP